jgi:formylglycine-generating enzyme required for sulfatase activity
MGTNLSFFKGQDLPVEVSWEDCREFCEKTGLEFPTEAQWEYACRAGATGPYSGTGNPDEMGWHHGNSGRTTHPVGGKNPNGFGLHDMHGNVMEWCQDVYDEEFYAKPGATTKDPACTSGSEARVVRGGSWNSKSMICRSALRHWVLPAHRDDFLGFRPSCSLP